MSRSRSSFRNFLARSWVSSWIAPSARPSAVTAMRRARQAPPEAASPPAGGFTGITSRADAADPAVARIGHVDVAGAIDGNALRAEEQGAGAKLYEQFGGFAPTVGVLGAVLGLIHVMENLSDPTKLGAGIAVAFVATIYGVGLANLVYLPIAGKLKYYISRMVATREMLIDGLVGIAVGDNPRIIEGRLRGYLH